MIIANSSELHTPLFRVLNDDQCRELFEAALECLERVGVQMHNAEARNLLQSFGGMVDGGIVRIPPNLVKQAIGTAPHEFTVWGREDKYAMRVALDRVHFGPGPTCTYFIDPSAVSTARHSAGMPV